jgi:amino acid transporter
MAEDLGLKADGELRRALDRRHLLFISMGEAIGASWLFAPLYAASYAGGAALLAWLIAGALVLLIAFANAEIASAIPRSGGLVRYPHYAFGGFVGFITAWAYLLSKVAVPSAGALTATRYLSFFFPQLYNATTGKLTPLGYLVAYLFLALFVYINYVGVAVVGETVYWIGWLKLAVLTLTAAAMIALAFVPSNFTAGGGFVPTSGTAPYTGWAAVLYAIPSAGVAFAYLGFRQAIEYGGEGKDPSRDVPFAVIMAILIAMSMYILLQVAFIGAIHWNVIGVNEGAWSALRKSISKAPLLQLFESLRYVVPGMVAFITTWLAVIMVGAVLSQAGAGFVSTGSAARALYGMAANGYLPGRFLELSDTRVPKWSLLMMFSVGALYLLPFPTWQSIVAFSTAARVLSYVVVGGVTAHALRRVAPDLNRPFRLSAVSVLAPAATAAASLIVYWSGFRVVSELSIVVLAGLPIYFGYYAHRRLKAGLGPSFLAGLGEAAAASLAFAYLYAATGGLGRPDDAALWAYVAVTAATAYGSVAIAYGLGAEPLRTELRAGLWLPAYVIVITALSYYGVFGPRGLIPFPWDTVIAVVVTLAFHYWAVLSAFRTKAIDQALGRA